MNNYCKKCGKELQEGTKFCSECGHEVSSGIRCPSCNVELDDNAAFCECCGMQIHVNREAVEAKNSEILRTDQTGISGNPYFISAIGIVIIIMIVSYIGSLITIGQELSILDKLSQLNEYHHPDYVPWSDLFNYPGYTDIISTANALGICRTILYGLMAAAFFLSDLRYKIALGILASLKCVVLIFPSFYVADPFIHAPLIILIILSLNVKTVIKAILIIVSLLTEGFSIMADYSSSLVDSYGDIVVGSHYTDFLTLMCLFYVLMIIIMIPICVLYFKKKVIRRGAIVSMVAKESATD